ncbi:hypothetical protein Sjap_004810 [Stephania japonica]|uniref:Uncharacterized protein n=1 Tax=Stephania japonica TaxID=461633 RepID=A0AAP0PI53_9MAGN
MAFNKLPVFAIAMVLSVLLIATMDLTNASHLDVWSGPGCNNRADRYIACGCHNIDPGLHGGWSFSYNGPLHSCTTKLTAKACRSDASGGMLEAAVPSHGRACSSSADDDHQIEHLIYFMHGFMCEGRLIMGIN